MVSYLYSDFFSFVTEHFLDLNLLRHQTDGIYDSVTQFANCFDPTYNDMVVIFFMKHKKYHFVKTNSSLNTNIDMDNFYILLKDIKKSDFLEVVSHLNLNMKNVILETIKLNSFDYVRDVFYKFDMSDGFVKQTFNLSAKVSNLEVFQYFHQKYNCVLDIKHLFYAIQNLNSDMCNYLISNKIYPNSYIYKKFFETKIYSYKPMNDLIILKFINCLKILLCSKKKIKEDILYDFLNTGETCLVLPVFNQVLENSKIKDRYRIFTIIENKYPSYVLLFLNVCNVDFSNFEFVKSALKYYNPSSINSLISKIIKTNDNYKLYELLFDHEIFNNNMLENILQQLIDENIKPHIDITKYVTCNQYHLFLLLTHIFGVTYSELDQKILSVEIVENRDNFTNSKIGLNMYNLYFGSYSLIWNDFVENVLDLNVVSEKYLFPEICLTNNIDMFNKMLYRGIDVSMIDTYYMNLSKSYNSMCFKKLAENKLKPSIDLYVKLSTNKIFQKMLDTHFPEFNEELKSYFNRKINDEQCVILRAPIDQGDKYYKCVNNHYYLEDSWQEYIKNKPDASCCYCGDKIIENIFTNKEPNNNIDLQYNE
jgi:hypothetical protein